MEAIGERGAATLQMIQIPTIEEKVKLPFHPKISVEKSKLEVISRYMDELDLDQDFEDEKNDYRDRLLDGCDVKMNKFSNIIDHLGGGILKFKKIKFFLIGSGFL